MIASGNQKYIGARYVPIIMGDWTASIKYEPLMVVLYQGTSYTSKTTVPTGVLPTVEEYWAKTGDYNAQVAHYTQTVENLKNNVSYCFDNILDLKNADFLPDNVCVQTKGFYEANDGGGAYYITTSEPMTENNCTVYGLPNGQYAYMLIENNTVNILCIGARKMTNVQKYDIAPFLQLFDDFISDKHIKLYIPSGIWSCSGYTFIKPIHIVGDYSFTRKTNGGITGTIVTAHVSGQQLVFKFSDANGSTTGTPQILTNFVLENIILSNSSFEINNNNYISTGYIPLTNAICVMQGAEFGTVNNLMFAYTNACNLSIESCNELYFHNTNFRNKEEATLPVMRLKKHNTRNVNSSIHFDFMQVEATLGSIFYMDDYVTNCNFGTIMFEPNQPNPLYTRYFCDNANYDDTNAIHMGVFECSSNLLIEGCHVDSLLFDGFSAYSIVVGGIQYIYDCLFTGSSSKGLFLTFGSINLAFSKKNFYLFRGNSFGGSVSYINFGNLVTTTDSSILTDIVPIIKAKYVCKFDINCQSFGNSNLIFSNELYKTSNNVTNSEIALLGDTTFAINIGETLSPLHTAIRAITANSGLSNTRQTMRFINDKTISKIMIRRTQTKGAAANLKFIQGSTIIEIDVTNAVNNIGVWNWVTIDASSIAGLSEGDTGICYNISGDNIGAIDCMLIVH